VSPVKYELGFYIQEGGILHSPRRKNLKSDIFLFLGIVLTYYETYISFSLAFSCFSLLTRKR
jgi:hypothetical protein